jgi:hypothetical protein
MVILMNLYIAKQLELRRSLSIELLCDSVNDCGRTQQLTWAEAWDEVRVEYTIDCLTSETMGQISSKKYERFSHRISHRN